LLLSTIEDQEKDMEINYEPIPELITASLNLESGIINEFLIMENSSETFLNLRKKLDFGMGSILTYMFTCRI